MADIFISYSQKDRDRVERLVDALTAEGYEVWWDLKIRAGESFDELIESTLEKVPCVLGVWSKNAVKSEWVRAESAWAKDQGIFVSVRIDDGAKLPLKFYHVNTASLSDWNGSRGDPRFRRLVADICEIAGPPRSRVQAEDDELPVGPPEVPTVQESSPAPTEKPAPPPDKPLPHVHYGVWLIFLAVFALIGGMIFFINEPEGVVEPEMVTIPAGEFQMGCVSGKGCAKDELPVHTVTFGKPFAMGKYEVTFAEYDRFAEATGREKPDDKGWGRGKRPVINVSWKDAQAYADWLSDQTHKRYRLPTEAEWEYAARGGKATPFSTGGCINTDQANYNGNYGWQDCPKTGVHREKTLEVGSFPANPSGLHQVHGNVWEWAQDCYHSHYEGAPSDGSAWKENSGGSCARRVLRGGSWNDRPWLLRSADRDRDGADYRNGAVGFRLAQDL